MDQPATRRTKVPDLGTAAFLTALLAGLLLCASAASAESVDLRIADNGEVTAFGKTYASMTDYHRSAEFKNSDRRCISAAPLFTSLAATDCSLSSTTINPEYNPENGSSFVIPVVFHVIKHTDGRGEVSDALLNSQIDVLNESFGAVSPTTGAGATDSKIQFVLATTDPNGAPTNGINRVTNDAYFNDADTGVAMKTALSWDPSRYLNMYTNTASGALGYATFPQESVGDPQDGVVLLWTSVGRNAPQGGVYDGGDTAVHEVGHWLGLHHTFNAGCGGAPYTSGDLVGDTVAEAEPQYQCTQAASACGGGNNPIENFMDYTPDACMNLFSVEQVNRMRCTLINYRGALAAPAATADFTAARNEKTVRFTDNSVGADGASIASRSWDFGDGQTSTETNPTHTYETFGTFAVTLTVTDDNGATGSRTIDVTLIAGETDPGGEGPSGADGANLSGGCTSVPSSGGLLSMLLVVIGFAVRRRLKPRI